MANIGETRTRYIRCIKPNSMKKPRVMQHLSSVEQLRCAGVVAAVTISRSAFPNRLLHEQVFDRFMCLDKGFHRQSTPTSDPSEIVAELQELLGRLLSSLETINSDGKIVRGFVCGKTRAYFRAGSLEYLENRRLSAFGSLATGIQRILRGFLVRSYYRRLRSVTTKMQAYARRKSARHLYLKFIEACLVIQCWSRQTYSKRLLITLRRNDRATKIQSKWRMVVMRHKFVTERFATVKIQACIRGAIQRPLYRKALAEAIEEAKLENQLKSLQRKLEEAEQKRIEAEQRAAEGAGNKTIVVYKDGSGGNGTSAPSKSPELTVAQQTLMDESSKMLEYLRKEVFKLRSQNAQLRTDFELLKENNQRLMDANASAGASFASLNQHAKTLSKENAKLKSDVTKYKDLSHQLQLSQVELKEELKMKQGTYIAEVHSRLQYQKTMMKIVDMIQDRCKDHRVVEDILHMSDDCESDYMTGPTGVDLTPVKRAQSRTGQESLTGKLKSFLFS
jgi:myosin-5